MPPGSHRPGAASSRPGRGPEATPGRSATPPAGGTVVGDVSGEAQSAPVGGGSVPRLQSPTPAPSPDHQPSSPGSPDGAGSSKKTTSFRSGLHPPTARPKPQTEHRNQDASGSQMVNVAPPSGLLRAVM